MTLRREEERNSERRERKIYKGEIARKTIEEKEREIDT